MTELAAMWGLMFAAAGVAICLVLSTVVLRSAWPADRKAAVGTYGLVASAGLLCESPLGDYLSIATPHLSLLMRLVSAGAPGAVWLLIVALFRDRKLTRSDFLPLAVSILLEAPAYAPWPLSRLFFWAWIGWSALLTLHALNMLISNWREDLVEARRRLRAALVVMGAIGCLAFLLLLARVSLSEAGAEPSWTRSAVAGLIFVTLSIATVVVLEARRDLFETRLSRPSLDDDLCARLATLMESEAPWRSEDISIGGLAAALQAPEYRLRRVIHSELGFRNFAEFINSYRLAAVKDQLARPGRISVAEEAFAAGFASLSPFNRAFKAETGMTPSAWRRERLSEISNTP